MLMFVFGAGASYDSDPERRPGAEGVYPSDEEFRPPLARELFSPPSRAGKDIINEFPLAAPVIMRLRHAVGRGEDIEEVLEGISIDGPSYPGTARQLLAFRGYLARLLSAIPDDWAEECQGLTNYVQLLGEADRWNAQTTHSEGRDPISCVTFNYDLLIEEAALRTFAHRIRDLGDYISSSEVHLYKPHGSVSWRRAARWSVPNTHWIPGEAGFLRALDEADHLQWLDEWMQIDPDTNEVSKFQDNQDATKVWLPALSIPVRRKADFTMPADHSDSLRADLGRVTTLVAIGWRARERHFLKLMEENMPTQPAHLVVVAENDDAAMETVNRLWETGKFQSYAIGGNGFSGFASPPTEHTNLRSVEGRSLGAEGDANHATHSSLTFDDLVTHGHHGIAWTRRQPGGGLTEEAGDVQSRSGSFYSGL